MFKKKGIIFDMDGVLFLSNEIHAKSYINSLSKKLNKYFNYKDFIGMRTESAFIKYFEDNNIEYDEIMLKKHILFKQDFASKLLKILWEKDTYDQRVNSMLNLVCCLEKVVI